MPKAFSSWVEPAAGAAAVWLCLGACAANAQQPGPAESPSPVLAAIAPLANDRALGYFIENAGEGPPRADAELCVWALNDWVAHSEGRLSVAPAAEVDAVIRVYFDSPGAGRYGEMRAILVGDRRGAEVYVRTETDSLGGGIGPAARDDPMLRDTIVYLTCLHEIGHALGMVHTAEFADVMYYFGFGGDIPAFFGRYRSRLESRADIAAQSGLSDGDIIQLLTAYPATP